MMILNIHCQQHVGVSHPSSISDATVDDHSQALRVQCLVEHVYCDCTTEHYDAQW